MLKETMTNFFLLGNFDNNPNYSHFSILPSVENSKSKCLKNNSKKKKDEVH